MATANKRASLFLAFVLVGLGATAQTLPFQSIRKVAGWPLVQGLADTSRNAFAGGLDFPRFAMMHLDADTLQDLLVLDSRDDRFMTFLNRSVGDSLSFIYAPAFEGFFPREFLHYNLLVADYNTDGKPDIFTNRYGFLAAHTNITPLGGPLQFSFDFPTIPAFYPPGTQTLVSSPDTDVPGIADVDADGDLDLVVFGNFFDKMELLRNLAVDSLGRTDTMLFMAASRCFGHVQEWYNPLAPIPYSLTLGVTCAWEFPQTAPSPGGPGSLKTLHQGGAVLPLNLNGDSLLDLIITDAGPEYAVAAINAGTRRVASMGSQEVFFPNYDTPINVPFFPVPFHLDINQDGRRDLLVAPNMAGGSNDTASVWHYHNRWQDNQPVFQLSNRKFLGESMIEVGGNASVAFADVDADQDPDMVVGNLQRYVNDSTRTGGLALYINVGTAQNPVFRLQDADWLGFYANQPQGTTSNLYLKPTFGDVDADGDADLLLGSNFHIRLYENTAAAGQPAQFQLQAPDWFGISAFQFGEIAPLLFDWDKDGDLDLIAGCVDGTLAYFENTGSPNSPNMALVTDQLGNVRTTVDVSPFTGRSGPSILDINFDGEPELAVGGVHGRVSLYAGLGLAPTATLDSLGQILPYPAGFDITAAFYPYVDTLSRPDSAVAHLVVGTQTGGLMLYEMVSHYEFKNDTNSNDTNIVVVEPQPASLAGWNLWPNPACHYATLKAPAGTAFKILDAAGRVVARGEVGNAGQVAVNTQNWPQAIYHVAVQRPNGESASQLLMVIEPY